MRLRKQMAFLAVLLAGTVGVRAQIVDYAAFLSEIADRSPQSDAADKGYQATHRGLRVGLAPEDPEVGLEYYFTDEARYELVLEQRFDFPTIYHQRNKIGKLGISKAQQEFYAERRNILAEISDNYLTLNYASERVNLLTERKEGMERLVALYEQGVTAGEFTAVELENARMRLISVGYALAVAQTGMQEAAANLQRFNAGVPVAVQGYPNFVFSGTRDEFIASALDYELQAAAIDTLIARRELKLSRQEWIPKLKAGYKLEMEGAKGTNALLAGISIPLWSNSGKTGYAKAVNKATKARYTVAEQSVRTRLGSIYDRYHRFRDAVNDQAGEGTCQGYPDLLKQGLETETGTLNAVSFLTTLDEWYNLMQERMSLQYETAQVGATMAICLM